MTEPQNHTGFDSTGFQWLSAEQCDAVVQIAKDAALDITRVYARGARVVGDNTSVKDDNSPLTEADLAAHHVIIDGLSVLTPAIPVVSEEDAASLVHRVAKKPFWLIDPLDGTKEFIARNGEFTVNIALVVQGEPVWGVVHAPAIGQTYWGGSGFGALKQDRNGVVVSLKIGDAVSFSGLETANGSEPSSPEVSSNDAVGAVPIPTPQSLRVVASKSHLNEATEAFISSLGVVELVQAGSSLKFCRVADGEADVYPRLAPTCEWDTAAAQAVVEGAGGYVFDMDGKRLRYAKPDLLNPSFIAACCSYEALRSKCQVEPVSNRSSIGHTDE